MEFATVPFCISLAFLYKSYQGRKASIVGVLENQSDRIENSLISAIDYTEHNMRYIAHQVVDNGV